MARAATARLASREGLTSLDETHWAIVPALHSELVSRAAAHRSANQPEIDRVMRCVAAPPERRAIAAPGPADVRAMFQ